jgi:hypothetical protein
MVSHLMRFSVREKSDHKTLLMLIIASDVTLLMLTQASASFISSDHYLYAYAASKNKNDTSTEDGSTDHTTTSPIGSKTFLKVTTKVSGGTSKSSDFTVSVSGKNPSPKSFSGSSSGTSVTLNAGKYEVTASGPSDYTTSYSSGCSDTASGGTPIKCTISNQYRNRPIPPPQPPVSNITITTNSSSIYSIPSTSVQVDRFSTNYTIAGTISSLTDSKDLITSTIVNDFDKNPNIGYIVNYSSGSQALSIPSQTQPGIPNPFVSIDMINQKITNVIQNAMGTNAAYSTNSPEKLVEIKCTFGMILADYNCSSSTKNR